MTLAMPGRVLPCGILAHVPDASRPQHCPTPPRARRPGAAGRTAPSRRAGFDGPGGLVTLTVPADVAVAAEDAGELELVDPEGLPLARVAVGSTYAADGAPDHRRRHPAHAPPVRRLPPAAPVPRRRPAERTTGAR